MVEFYSYKNIAVPIKTSYPENAFEINVKGLVQGVGFRPHIYRIALNNKITGWVKNSTIGVQIKAIGNEDHLEKFIRDISLLAPPVAEISEVQVIVSSPNGEKGFHIIPSSGKKEEITEVSPDIAVCADCLKDLENQNHRIDYPLINCTNCGPRFSIIKALPYDRPQTTMAAFPMCSKCSDEYSNIHNRRFHAQPVACNACGPVYSLYSPAGEKIECKNLIREAARILDEGKILAIKGTGGFHLACDALNSETVNRLRTGKLREGKPFAIMFSSIETLSEFASLKLEEKTSITSWQRPIVLVDGKNNLQGTVNAGLTRIGAFLPYMPFQYLLFRHLSTKAIIFTSGNLSEEPVIIDPKVALRKLGQGFDFLIDYNRDIYNRTDDSVVQHIDGNIQIIRRSRGFVPKPITLEFDAEGIFATGAELKNCFCLGKGNLAIMSQHIGDLKNMETFNFFAESLSRFSGLFRFKPLLIATDMHPDYMTSFWSKQQGLPVEVVQHHHAHIASCLAEHHIREKVIGLSFDGTGYGTDGHIWGSEIMLCDLCSFERLGHFEYLPMPGGDKAVEEPWRMALACLFLTYGESIPDQVKNILNFIEPSKLDLVMTALKNNINISRSSGIGRLFDAAASLLGLCNKPNFEAEGPMRLEDCATEKTLDFYKTEIEKGRIIKVNGIIEGIVDDLKAGVRKEIISTRFHNSIIEATVSAIPKNLNCSMPEKIILSGGAFQNRRLLSGIREKLEAKGFQVLTNHKVPVNDGGIALGQLAVAAARRNKICV
ncbi:MAG: carbamoyltransferase HypF [Bacteroides sp.]|jgi:hydrogenase maturation protein HypF|nr:carbamoyltransferase HypF [Bacteroides sp.]